MLPQRDLRGFPSVTGQISLQGHREAGSGSAGKNLPVESGLLPETATPSKCKQAASSSPSGYLTASLCPLLAELRIPPAGKSEMQSGHHRANYKHGFKLDRQHLNHQRTISAVYTRSGIFYYAVIVNY